MTDRLHEVERAEREANEALYAVDPELARELGYKPPPATVPFAREQAALARTQMQNVAFHQHALQQQLANTAAQQHVARGPLSALGNILGSSLGGALGGAIGKRVPERYFPPRYR